MTRRRACAMQRIEVAGQRQQTRIKRGALLLLLGIGREVEHGELDRDFFLRAVGGLEEIEVRIGDFDLPWAAAILALRGAGNRREPGQRVEDGRFSGASRADDSGFHYEELITKRGGHLRGAREMKRHAPSALNSTTGITRVVCF